MPPFSSTLIAAPQGQDRPHQTTHRRRGSVIVLVVVSLVLMAALAATFLQVSRTQRLSSVAPVDNIDLVLDAVTQQIQSELANDLFGPDRGNGRALFDASGAGGAADPIVEPYDAPWTNFTSTPETVPGLSGAPVPGGNATFGDGDDAWLASTAPTNRTGNLQWPQITTLTGAYYPTDGNPDPRFREIASGTTDSSAILLNNTTVWNQDVDITDNTSDTDLVDADGDGIGDSRFERAPITIQDGVEYFMAVRIVDLSSMVNVNTATAITSHNGTDNVYGTPAAYPQGRNPTDIDLYRFVNKSRADNLLADTRSLLGLRMDGDDTTARALPITIADRDVYWNLGPSQWGNFQTPTVRLSVEEEIYLRYRNGFTPPPGLVGVGNGGRLQTLMPAFLDWVNGGSGTLESETFTDDYANATTYFGDDNAAGRPWTNMFTSANNSRLYATTQSGATEFAPPFLAGGVPGATTAANRFLAARGQMKFPLNDVRFTSNNDSDRDAAAMALAGRIQDIYNAGTTTPPLPAGQTVVREFAEQFAANVMDYRDEDNFVTVLNTTPRTYGFEGLPVITEVYAQRDYEATSNGGTTGPFEITWTSSGTAGYAIELYNPYQSRILLSDIQIELNAPNAAPVQLGGAGADIASIPGVAAAVDAFNAMTYPTATYSGPFTQANTLYPNDRLILYVDGSGASPVSGLFLPAEPGVIAADISAASTAWLSSTRATGNETLPEEMTIALRARSQDGDAAGPFIMEPYFVATSQTMPASFIREDVTDFATAGAAGVRQQFDLGNGEGLNALTIEDSDFDNNTLEPETNPTQNQATDRLGTQVKAGPPGLNIPHDTADEPQVFFRDNDRLRYPGELAMVLGLSYDPANTLPAAFKASGITPATFDSLRIDLNPTTAGVVDAATSHLNVPHAVILLESLSTLSPARDGLDNNGDGTPDPNGQDTDTDGEPDSIVEAFVPGKINLNTAPVAVLATALPFAADYTNPNNFLQSLVAAIELEREAPSRRLGNEEGLAYVNELWTRFNDPMAPGADPAVQIAANTDGNDSFALTDADGNLVPLDLLGNDVNSNVDGIIDDREEQMLLLNWLQQTTTTRSDLYAAYILVKGYESGNLDRLVESGRMILILDRSGMRKADDPVRVLARFKY